MKKITFSDGIWFALVTSFISSTAYFLLSSLFTDNLLIRLFISVISTGYIIYLLNKSNETIGRITVLAVWLLITVASWLTWPSAVLFVMINLISIWLIRSLYFYSSLFASVADLMLTLSSAAIAVWVASYTSSLFLTIWCFFLTQALFVMIPSLITRHKITHQQQSFATQAEQQSKFQSAYQIADAAIKKLSNYS